MLFVPCVYVFLLPGVCVDDVCVFRSVKMVICIETLHVGCVDPCCVGNSRFLELLFDLVHGMRALFPLDSFRSISPPASYVPASVYGGRVPHNIPHVTG